MIRALALLFGLCVATSSAADELPKFFRYLSDVDPSIRQDMRYAGPHNFTGALVPGYEAPECILTEPAAHALKRVQARMRPHGLSLVVFDCYRPQRAVRSFVTWAGNADESTKGMFYPRVPKDRLLKGYISARSAHARGSTVDLGITKISPTHVSTAPNMACTDPAYSEAVDGGIDMGTGFDCFDKLSHTASSEISEIAKRNRWVLVKLMTDEGFENYRREWWHFQLKNEPYQKTSFDFPILPKPK